MVYTETDRAGGWFACSRTNQAEMALCSQPVKARFSLLWPNVHQDLSPRQLPVSCPLPCSLVLAMPPNRAKEGDPQWSRDLVWTELLPIEFTGVISAGFSPARLDRGVLDLGHSGTAMRR